MNSHRIEKNDSKRIGETSEAISELHSNNYLVCLPINSLINEEII